MKPDRLLIDLREGVSAAEAVVDVADLAEAVAVMAEAEADLAEAEAVTATKFYSKQKTIERWFFVWGKFDIII